MNPTMRNSVRPIVCVLLFALTSSPVAADMIEIPAGVYEAGSLPDAGYKECEKNNSVCKRKWFTDEEPKRKVFLDAFFIDLYEVTQKDFQNVMGHNPSSFKGDDLPVEGATWYEAKSYCEQTGKRLPTEAEWEKAARGGKRTVYPWGDAVLSKRANFCDAHCGERWKEKQFADGFEHTAPVGSFAPNGYGLHDMAGNVYEWVADWYDEDYYETAPSKNPKGPKGGRKKVIRGGSWINYSSGVRPADRSDAKTRDRYNFIGFRCAR